MNKEEEKSLKGLVLDLTKLIDQLRSKRYLQIVDDIKKFLFYSLLSGIARGAGFTIGVTIVAALIFWILSKLTVIPFFGDWIIDLLDYIQQAKLHAF